MDSDEGRGIAMLDAGARTINRAVRDRAPGARRSFG